ncbi:MAG: sigma-70 family RNA polymerase sigma factor [Terracidiphilus sp.]|jgi:RNA polymerase sigma-70 factor (ECF subfamily)
MRSLAQSTSRAVAAGGYFDLAMLFYGQDDTAIGLTSLRLNAASLGSEDRGTVRLEERVARLYEEFRVPLYRYLLCIGLVSHEVEDVVQETFLRLYRNLHAGGSDENLRSWIYQVARNQSLNYRKSRRHLVETTPEVWQHLSQSASDTASSAEEQLLHKERMNRVHKALTELTRLQRDCVHLRVEGFRYREIAEILGVTTATVSGSLRHAIAKLAKEYS